MPAKRAYHEPKCTQQVHELRSMLQSSPLKYFVSSKNLKKKKKNESNEQVSQSKTWLACSQSRDAV